jgi:hypothetical protein
MSRTTSQDRNWRRQKRWYRIGALTAFGLMGMAHAIVETYGESCRACPICGKASNGWVGVGDRARCIHCDNRERLLVTGDWPYADGPYR